ncbi:hypothetical protein CLV28_1827 [Sediminihabitans luteus]|uniref:Uncharacterized protein n=1 Tax=Sediminihabitans luteus TaxID=1138585 RepID=A0A2M9CR62_9CELL|nr:hypothetical protein [Sediminihabitans luteus]PJJ74331.1 hypothetical protein CLV28_1827 [Sediminihabitans luteus]GIJ00443.1 hypothetical protein Slu03_28200 [Sediminihabitans luteus]
MPQDDATFEEATELVVDYRYVEDAETALLEPGEVRSDEPDEPGWEFTVRLRDVVRSRGATLNAGDWTQVVTGVIPADLDETVAVVIEILREHMPTLIPVAVHTVDGSVEEFEAEFDDAFDLAVGAPELA